MTAAYHDVIVVGAGFAGLYAVHRAVAAGLSVLGIDAADGVGGTWYWNRYPGARCDVESVDYSYSFDEELQQTWTWSERFASQPEILAYLEHVARRFDLTGRYLFGTWVSGAVFDEGSGTWEVYTSTGDRHRAQFLLCATGCLSAVNRPDLPGIDDFAGEVYYTAAWPQQHPDLQGRHVGLVGTGSSGIQVAPLIADAAASLTVFQRSPNYSVPVPNRPWTDDDLRRIRAEYPERRRVSAYAPAGTPHTTTVPPAADNSPAQRTDALWQRWSEGGVLFSKTFPDQLTDLAANDVARQFAEDRIRELVEDPAVADDLIPVDHPIGTKRICTDSGYYQIFNRAHVHLVNLRREPITAITADGVHTTAGDYPCDTLVFATGFDAMTGALTRIDPVGADGVRLDEVWADGPVTFLGMMIPQLPNLFTFSGPGSPSVLANMVLHAEIQVDWVIDLLTTARSAGFTQVDVRRDAADAWTRHVAAVADGTLFVRATSSWYLGANIDGKKRAFMPFAGGFGVYRAQCDEVAENDYAGLVFTAR
ncbi:cyclohexanone monooxygenase [Mycobacterium antarcticum]|uniref:flavin-containing monooxygenase n=1 Tax=unclassified Mycolicibacterium TaxID=2636767 RepID=UPI00238668DD|nr:MULTISPECIES: NAD(P)/FAD-dependent oxidoreductase [unclassified Mycolicibacterium]GLP74590.1 cyclohexanone monooxygenase [Mycolicibacterium sp. TUM20983]GLP80385.1 cyclohexanone monooxygenase [Mycolicibacterium sp. TUM20984]